MKKQTAKKDNLSQYAILGFLLNQPSSGYEIGQIMEQSTTHFWQESDASIYPTLKKLESEGMVTSRSEFVGKRERTIFTITPAGKKEFQTWMTRPAKKEKVRSELLLKIFFGASTTKEEILKHLHTQIEKTHTAKIEYQTIEQNIFAHIPESHPHKLFWKMTLDKGIIDADADLAWLNECIEALKKK